MFSNFLVHLYTYLLSLCEMFVVHVKLVKRVEINVLNGCYLNT